jgi:hypothetical protein
MHNLKTISRRRKNNTILLKNDEGEWIDDSEQLHGLVNDFYKKLLIAMNYQNDV